MMACALCLTSSSSFVTPADRKCAFPDGEDFHSDNLHCGTMQALKGSATFSVASHERSACLVPVDGRFVVLVWEGLGAAVIDAAHVADLGGCVPLTLEVAQAAIAART